MRAVLLIALSLTAAAAQAATYGRPMPDGAAQPIAAVMAAADTHAGKALKVAGRITQVCQKTGCWLMLDNNGEGVRVRTRHDFFVPKTAQGEAVVHGTLEAVEMSAEQAAHYAADGAAPAQRREWQIVATSVALGE